MEPALDREGLAISGIVIYLMQLLTRELMFCIADEGHGCQTGAYIGWSMSCYDPVDVIS